jgi:hypothetical protein
MPDRTGRRAGAGDWSVVLIGVGPLTRHVVDIVTGMRLIDPDFTVASRPTCLAGRL